jgi:Arc/MetJ-type ribon-helix-helix transcriptional regulator
MKQVLLELPDELAEELEQVAPGRERKRSAFLREAVRKALDEVAEERMAAAYREQPDDTEPAYLDPEAWEARSPGRRTKSKRS